MSAGSLAFVLERDSDAIICIGNMHALFGFKVYLPLKCWISENLLVTVA